MARPGAFEFCLMRAPVPDSDFVHLVKTHTGAARLVEEHPWLRVDTAGLADTAGWKLHISSVPVEAEALLMASLPVLCEAGIPFKVLRSVGLLEELNDGRLGLTQVGKFITVYGGAESRIAALLPALQDALSSFSGPAIVTDFRVRGQAPLYLRYGPFDGRYTVDALSQRIRMLRLPSGEDIPDAAAGGDPARVAPALIECDPPSDHAAFLRQRYLLVSALNISAKGAVFIAVDQHAQPRRLLLAKTARQGAHADRFGRDALDALEREHALLTRLSQVSGLPPAGEFIRNGGAAAVVRPYLEGDTLWDLWTQPAARTQENRRALGNIISAVACTIEALHGAGVLLRDLSPGNVLVGEGGPVLLDLELAHLVGSDTSPYRRGTPGFYDPTADRFAKPASRDDRYALLALAFMVETGVFPALFPGGLAHAPVSIAPDSFAHPWRQAHASLDDKDNFARAWGRLTAEWGSPHSPTPATSSCFHDLKNHFAEELARSVAHAARETLPFEEATVYHGLAGLLLVAAEVAPEALDSLAPDTLRAATSSLAAPAREVAHIPGLYFGISGIALALLVVGQRLEDRDITRCGQSMLEVPRQHDSRVPDITHGWAGYAHACLAAHRVQGGDGLLELAATAGDRFVAMMQHQGAGAVWPWPDGPFGTLSGAAPHGFAHGTAGVVYALLGLHAATGENRYRDAALSGLDTLHTTAQEVPGVLDAAWWAVSENDSACWNAWCHGTPGIVKTLAQAVRVLNRTEDRALLWRALRGVDAANNPGYCLCHGIASRLDAHADALALPDQEATQSEAAALHDTALLAHLDLPALDLSGHGLERGGISRGLMTGAAGPLRTLLRFQNPRTALLLP
jgi:serine/threonine protein kinase